MQQLDEPTNIISLPRNLLLDKQTKIARCTVTYMSWYIGKLLKNSSKSCPECLSNITSQIPSRSDDFIEARQYEKAELVRPNNYLNFLVSHSLFSLFYLIPILCTSKNISKLLEYILKENFHFNPMNCSQYHNLGDKLCNIVVRCSLFWWSKSINKIMKGKDTKFAKYLSSNPANVDPIKLHAYRKFESKRKYLKK